MPGGLFADRLLEAIDHKRSHVVVGLDPDVEYLPPDLKARYGLGGPEKDSEALVACYEEFLTTVLESVRTEVIAVKIQIAYFEALGARGYALYERMIAVARQMGYLVIADVKRGDIGSTAEAYAWAHLDVAGADAVTLNPYFGTDGLEPFLTRVRRDGKGVFILVKTSNPGSAELQDLRLESGLTVYEHVADAVNAWGEGTEGARGYRSVGAVVGGTHPIQGAALRRRMPTVPLLIPGYGAQGAQAQDLAGLFDSAGTGAVVNSARAILYAYRTRDLEWPEAARAEAGDMRTALWMASGRG
ncbi:MAG: orotidine-5'-phosphate decarboxylase [Thermoleophilia bacterium]|jgi:orotidine-5'-phosphate decarboxylase